MNSGGAVTGAGGAATGDCAVGGGGFGGVNPCGVLEGSCGGPPEMFLDLGHTEWIDSVAQQGDRVASQGGNRWMLWDTISCAQVNGGVSDGAVDLEGGLLLVRTSPGAAFELRDGITGDLRAAVAAPHDEVGLAIDGSYAWTRTALGITVWSPDGVELLTWAGAAGDNVFAAPGELRVPRNGPPSWIEVVAIDGSPTTMTPTFNGVFNFWFLDGERFLTNVGSTARLYSKDGALEWTADLPRVSGGTGDYLWAIDGGSVSILGVADQAHLGSYSGSRIVATRFGFGLIHVDDAYIEIVHLDGPVPTSVVEPVALASLSAFDMDQGGRWAVSGGPGVIYQKGTTLDPLAAGTLGCGPAQELGGSASGSVAISTRSGKILVYDAALGGTGHLATVPIDASLVALSSDGSRLAAQSWDYRPQSPKEESLRVFSLPSGVEEWSFLGSSGGHRLSLSGTRLSWFGLDGLGRRVTDLGVGDIYQGGGWALPLPSPDGKAFVVSDYPSTGLYGQPCGATQFYEGATQVNAVPGCAVGWLDDNRVLVQSWGPGIPAIVYQGSAIYDRQGQLLSSPPLPPIEEEGWGIESVAPDRILARCNGTIYDIATGGTLAEYPSGLVTVAGAQIVYPCGTGICAVLH